MGGHEPESELDHAQSGLVGDRGQLLDAASRAGEIRSGIEAYELMRGVGNICIGAEEDPRYDARRVVGLLLAGLRRPD
ncbi:SbtR family transcriptional regulator [Nocardiopsis xinjiangensis]|uniref:SbtR family transcriptional regulator n=1 Tax=Nocardiopsis xinjiangensis TaxID=124285 RepID=UPI0003470EDD